MKIIDNYIESFSQLCKDYKVDKLYIFGSALGQDFNIKSDLDFLVKFQSIEPEHYFENYINFKESLKVLFERDIDLL